LVGFWFVRVCCGDGCGDIGMGAVAEFVTPFATSFELTAPLTPF
jgi:hypothetical protein